MGHLSDNWTVYTDGKINAVKCGVSKGADPDLGLHFLHMPESPFSVDAGHIHVPTVGAKSYKATIEDGSRLREDV